MMDDLQANLASSYNVLCSDGDDHIIMCSADLI